MVENDIKTAKIIQLLITIGFFSLLVLIIRQQILFPFMLEDMTYSVNLKSGKDLAGIGDIFAGIAFDYAHYEGCVLAGIVLQLLIFAGEYAADFFNVAALLVVSLLIALLTNAKRQKLFLVALPLFLMIGLNTDWKYTYFWQYGAVHFFYPAIPLLLLLILINNALEANNITRIGKTGICGGLLALITGLMNPGYGAVVLCMAAGVAIISKRLLGWKHVAKWNLLILAGAMIGETISLLAPGNYGEESLINGIYLTFSVVPAVMISMLVLAILMRIGGWLSVSSAMLVFTLGCAIVLRFVTGIIPGLSPNGLMTCVLILGITLFCNLLYRINLAHPEYRVFGFLCALCSWFYAAFTLVEEFLGVM